MDLVALHLLQKLPALAPEIQFFALVQDGPDDEVLQPKENLEIIRFKAPFPIVEQVLIPRKARRLKLDLLHFTSNTAAIKARPKILITVHDLIFWQSEALFTGGYSLYQAFGNLYRRRIFKPAIKNAAQLITVSALEKANIEANFLQEHPPISVVPNAQAHYFKPISDPEALATYRAKYDLPEHFLLFLGNTDPKKNSLRVIQSFAQHCQQRGMNYKLVVADLKQETILDYLHEVNLEDYIDAFFPIDYLPNQDLPYIMNLASLLLYPSLEESFGLALLEAMACGLPVISSKTPALENLAANAAYLVDPLAKEAIAEAIQTLLLDPNLRSDLRAKGLKRCKDFNTQYSASQTLKIYRSLQDV